MMMALEIPDENAWAAIDDTFCPTDVYVVVGEIDEDGEHKPLPRTFINFGNVLREGLSGSQTGNGAMRLTELEEARLLRMAEQLELYAATIRNAMRGREREAMR